MDELWIPGQPAFDDRNWCGWGDPAKARSLAQFPRFRLYLEDRFGRRLEEGPPPPLPVVPASRVSLDTLRNHFPSIRPDQFSLDPWLRLRSTSGKSYHDLIRIREGIHAAIPDALVFPTSSGDVAALVTGASRAGLTLVPVGWSSNVTGALDFSATARPMICIDMRSMNRILHLDRDSGVATVEAGIRGPELESALQAEGFTLGHFPQSFEYSTLGGWLSTRSAGQESGQYGKIEDLIQGLRIETPQGTLDLSGLGRDAEGPDLKPLFMGAEGTLGLITEAKLVLSRKPAGKAWKVCLFRDFATGIQALQDVAGSGIRPAVVRLSDASETSTQSLLSGKQRTWIDGLAKWWMTRSGFSAPCLLLLGFNRLQGRRSPDLLQVSAILRSHGARSLPGRVGRHWERTRFDLPYLRDSLVAHGILIDTFETVGHWKDILRVKAAVSEALSAPGGILSRGGLCMSHLSHVYPTGSSIYFTVLAPQETGRELDQWTSMKTAVTEAIQSAGGALSHHHGIGSDHQRWYRTRLTDLEASLLRTIKDHLDPDDILNPGKLFDEKEGTHG